jgi:tetratricopeptide (TPR) repeat protein
VKASIWTDSNLPWAAVFALWGLAFTLACRLADAGAPQAGGDSLAALLFGGSRRALSGDLFERADLYFHKGVEHASKQAFTNGLMQRWLADIAPARHLHAEGADAAEIIPWLRLATHADPQNVEAFLVMSFWLSTQTHRPDLAEQVLLDAQRNNPGDYRILLEKGRLFLRTGRFARAEDALDAALTLWPRGVAPEDPQAALDRAELYTYRAFLYEIAGKPREAAQAFKKVLDIFPERGYVRQRAESLESGQVTRGAALELLQGLFERPDHHVCTEEAEGAHQ